MTTARSSNLMNRKYAKNAINDGEGGKSCPNSIYPKSN